MKDILVAKSGANVSQMHYAKKGIVTPEMEYVAIRENVSPHLSKNVKITPEYVRKKSLGESDNTIQHKSSRIRTNDNREKIS